MKKTYRSCYDCDHLHVPPDESPCHECLDEWYRQFHKRGEEKE
ncbi:MAG: hypothetical protein HeimC3_41030 [Candidatus Heimdallarchaeota archaeon LC_3]|nr:MAG: hypothetical protein HeimC3_41030 [Candidatus Heimdallarchaeota archaeon LC_3]